MKSLECWTLYDRTAGREYLHGVRFPSERHAQAELVSLLKPYSAGHEWRSRLEVGPVETPFRRTRRRLESALLIEAERVLRQRRQERAWLDEIGRAMEADAGLGPLVEGNEDA